MLEEAHHLELPEDPLRADEALEHVGQLLERDPLPVARVGDGPHDAEGAVPDRTVGLELGVGVACKNNIISIQVLADPADIFKSYVKHSFMSSMYL